MISALQEKNNKKSNQSKKQLKLHSADIAYLKILAWCHAKGGKCYLTKEQWPEWLVRFGGKANAYKTQKTRWSKMKALGYSFNKPCNGNLNKEYDHFITAEGLKAVDNFLTENQKTAPRKSKNGPSKILKPQKTAPPLTHAQTIKNKHAKTIEKLGQNDPEKAQTYRYLAEAGFYPSVAVSAMKKYSRSQIYQAYTYAKERRPDNPGAYITKMLRLMSSL